MQPAKNSVCGPFSNRLNRTILNIENDDRTLGNNKKHLFEVYRYFIRNFCRLKYI